MLRPDPRMRPWPALVAVLALVLSFVVLQPAGAAQAAAGTFRNPVGTRPDPFMTYFNGNYHLTMTEGDAIKMRRAPSVAGLVNAPAVELWRDSDTSRNRNVWAPEFYRVGNLWYLYYTADNGVDENHRLYVLESSGDDPLGPYHFKARLVPPNRDVYAIDAALMRHNGRLYLAWAGTNAYQHNGINIAPLSNPWTVSGNAVALNAAGGCPEVREGPAFLYRNGRTWMTYSACDTGKPDYQVWQLSIAGTADPLVPANWHATQDLPAGDPGPSTGWINDDGRSSGVGALAYTGAWNSGTGCTAQCFWGDDHWTDAAGATATFTFTGTQLALLSVRDVGNGIAAISVDGQAEQRVDLYGAIRVGETLNYLSPRLAYGTHTVRVRVTGEKNTASGAAYISIDRAEVWTN